MTLALAIIVAATEYGTVSIAHGLSASIALFMMAVAAIISLSEL